MGQGQEVHARKLIQMSMQQVGKKTLQYELIVCFSILSLLFCMPSLIFCIFTLLSAYLRVKKSPWVPEPRNIPLWDMYVPVDSKSILLIAVILSSFSKVAHYLRITVLLSKGKRTSCPRSVLQNLQLLRLYWNYLFPPLLPNESYLYVAVSTR